MIGEKYGRLTILATSEDYISPKGRVLPKVEVLCDCGNTLKVLLNSLKTGHTMSCGCYRAEINKLSKNNTHGKSSFPEYLIWKGMKARCFNMNNEHYLDYGGRGITVCARWSESFESFYGDMGERPDGLTLDRKDNNGNYEPSNCRWVSWVDQQTNKRMRKDNTSKKTGVYYHKNSQSWDVIWKESGERKTKCFSIKKYGGAAFESACNFRDLTVERLNSLGAGYSETHGK